MIDKHWLFRNSCCSGVQDQLCTVVLCMRAQSCLTETPLAVTSQAPLSIFPRQQYWSGLTFPPPGDLSNPGIEPESPVSPALVCRFFITKPPVKPMTSSHKWSSKPKTLIMNSVLLTKRKIIYTRLDIIWLLWNSKYKISLCSLSHNSGMATTWKVNKNLEQRFLETQKWIKCKIIKILQYIDTPNPNDKKQGECKLHKTFIIY